MPTASGKNSGKVPHLALETFLPYRLSILTNRISNAIARDYAERFGLTVPDWRVMAVLGRFGADTATGICDNTAMDKVTVSRATKRLLSRTLVSRKTDAEDRRRTIFALSAAGLRIYNQILPVALAHEKRLLAGLSEPEVAQLDGLLTKLQQQSQA